jgi:CDP-diacylglycerol--serine O-phosphatidyltransferase
MPSPAAAAIPASTVFAYPIGFHTYAEALPALAMVIVPALLMVSTIRFRSFKTFDLQSRRSYAVLMVFAIGLALLASHPEIVLVAVAYLYLLSGLIGFVVQRARRSPEHAATAEEPPPERALEPKAESTPAPEGPPEDRRPDVPQMSDLPS